MKVTCQCGRAAELATGREIYPSRPDLAAKRFYLCRPCRAWVGCHKDGRPFGTPADARTRRARKKAHGAFDPLWVKRGMSRREAYTWLAAELGIEVDKCHIAMFDAETCERVVQIIIREKGI